MDLSVIICTFNPRTDYLERVLDSLQRQTLPREQWELIVVDNASNPPVNGRADLSWHPTARIIREEKPGLALARLRGIAETSGKLLVFADDDNVLDREYLSEALNISDAWPQLGLWGGSIVPEFEIPPPAHLRPYFHLFAVREISAPAWSNIWSCREAEPVGAGICMRRSVAEAYAKHYLGAGIEITGRKGQSLASGEDTEIAYINCRILGLGMGVIPALKLTHLIAKRRINDAYVARLAQGISTSSMLLRFKWAGIRPPSPYSPASLFRLATNLVLKRGIERRFLLAAHRARVAVHRIIAASGRPPGQ